MATTEQSLAAFRSFIMTRTLPEKQQAVNSLLVLAARQYQQGHMSQDYLTFSLFPQLLPLVQADQVAAIRQTLEKYAQPIRD
jgi:hypothetical protein